jgi:Spy/CpxP family protein refolding chaperone
MKKVMWMVLAGLFIAVGSAQAHCGKCGMDDAPQAKEQGSADKDFDKMGKELKLTAEQKAQVKSIMEEKRQKKQAIMEQKQAAMAALHEEVKAKLKTVLSEEQVKAWEAKKEGCPLCKDGKPCKDCEAKKGKGKKGGDHEHKGRKH